ncbi:MAG: hypothetical protein RI973_783 [Bacteroidota bacterium]
MPVRLLLLLLLLPFLPACNVTRFLDASKGEKYLTKNVIVQEKKKKPKIKNWSSYSGELSKLCRQQPNRKFFGVPRQYFYYSARDTVGRSRISKFIRGFFGETFSEEPVILDSQAVEESALAMKYYLQSRGFFNADVSSILSEKQFSPGKVTVTYLLNPGRRYSIDSISFVSSDTTIQGMLQSISPASFLKSGSAVDVKLYDQEVARITRHLRNNGYAYFYPQYIRPLVATDSSNVTFTVSVRLEVMPPPGRKKHQQFSVGNIYVYPNYDPAQPATSQPDTLVDGLFFSTGGKPFWVKPRTLANSFYFRSGQLFSQEKVDLSERQLSSLGVFQPLVINYDLDTVNQQVLNFYVPLSAAKKWEIGFDFDLNTTERRSIVGNRNLIGLNFSPTLRNRNFMKGAELLVSNLDFGIELALFSGRKNLVNALDFRFQNDLYFPRFVDYLKLWKGLENIGITSERLKETLRQKATTRLSAGFNSLVLLNNYKLRFANTTFGYEIPLSPRHQLLINHFGFDIVIPTIEPNSPFDSLLNNIPSLQNSFSRQFITGFFLRDVNFIYNAAPKLSRSSWYFRSYFDLSGIEEAAVNSVYNSLSGKSERFKFFGVNFSQYAKIELDGRYYLQLAPQQTLVARLNTGVVLPYYQSEDVPYIKQFYVGGPYSIRGWYARELGPGQFVDPITSDARNRPLFYQSGNYKLEFNLEYRFFFLRPLGLFNLYGAFFVDGGNVWTQREDTARPGAHLSWRRSLDENGRVTEDLFLRQMAVATGFGTRWDFTYFILRLDLGTPVRNNFPDPARNQRYLVDFSKWQLRDIRYQLALGYPF